jgi:SAM-dependent methyltransferase
MAQSSNHESCEIGNRWRRLNPEDRRCEVRSGGRTMHPESPGRLRTENWALVCPSCKTALQASDEEYACPLCHQSFPLQDGVVRFTGTDEFYENRYEPVPLNFDPDEKSIIGKALLYLVSMHYFWFARKYIKAGGRLLDIAGGAGTRYFTRLGPVAGTDVSFPAAREMAKLYGTAFQADASAIPLEAGTVDAVLCRFFLEHVAPEKKGAVLGEIRRTLRDGGVFIALQDCDCDNILWRWAKRDEGLFRERFIENDGHYGLLRAEDNILLLKEAGFEVLHTYAANKTPFVSLSMLEWMQPYGKHSMLARVLLKLVPIVTNSRLLNAAYTFSTTLLDDLVEPFLPMGYARYILTVCRAVPDHAHPSRLPSLRGS